MLKIFGIFEESLEDYLKMARTRCKPRKIGNEVKVGDYLLQEIHIMTSTLYNGETDYEELAKVHADGYLAERMRSREAHAAVEVKYDISKVEWGKKTFVVCELSGKTLGKSPFG